MLTHERLQIRLQSCALTDCHVAPHRHPVHRRAHREDFVHHQRSAQRQPGQAAGWLPLPRGQGLKSHGPRFATFPFCLTRIAEWLSLEADSRVGSWFATWQIGRRRAAHLAKNPDAKIISLGIGDTTEPIPTVITDAMVEVRMRTYLGS